MDAADLLNLSRRELAEIVAEGHPIDPTALDDTEYHGTSIGLPEIAVKLSWRKFKKVFRREPDGGVLRGWNVQCVQNAIDEPWLDHPGRSGRVTYWHYRVVAPDGRRMPGKYDRGLLIDYGPGGNPAWHYIRWIRDPLVAVNPGRADLLLGFSYVECGPLCFGTPTFFSLQRGAPLTYAV